MVCCHNRLVHRQTVRSENQIVVANPRPRGRKQLTRGCGRAQKIAEGSLGAKAEHAAAAIDRDARQFSHDIFHSRFARRREQNCEIVDAEMRVDNVVGDDLAIGENFWNDHGLDAFRPLIGFERVVTKSNCKERIRFDKGLPPLKLDGDAQRLRQCASCLGRSAQDVDVMFERCSGGARADLDVERDVRRHVVMRETNDARGGGAVAADTGVRNPLLRRDDAPGMQERFGFRAEPVHVFDIEVIGEDDLFVQPMQPMRALPLGAVPKFAEPRFGDDRIARAESDELSSRQLRVTRQRLEDVANVVVGDLHALPHGAARQMRTAFVISYGFHKQ